LSYERRLSPPGWRTWIEGQDTATGARPSLASNPRCGETRPLTTPSTIGPKCAYFTAMRFSLQSGTDKVLVGHPESRMIRRSAYIVEHRPPAEKVDALSTYPLRKAGRWRRSTAMRERERCSNDCRHQD